MTETIKEVMELLIEYANGGMSGLYPPEDDIQELVDYILDLQEQLDEARKSELDKEYRISKAIEYIENNKEYTTIKKATKEWQYGKVKFEEIDENILNEDMIKELLEILGSDKE